MTEDDGSERGDAGYIYMCNDMTVVRRLGLPLGFRNQNPSGGICPSWHYGHTTHKELVFRSLKIEMRR